MRKDIIREIPISHWNMPNLLREWKFQKPRYWCPKAYVGWAGLGVHFHRNGRVFWEVYYNVPGQPKKIHVLGELHPQTFRYQEAERAGKAVHDAAKAGLDPRLAVVSRDAAPATIRDMGERFMAEWSRKRKRTADRDEMFLLRYVNPAIGDRVPASIEYADVMAILAPVAKRAPSQADQLKATISKMFNWGRGPFGIKHNPVEKMPAFHVKPKEDDIDLGAVPLALDQIGAFWHGLDRIGLEPVTREYARFLLLTGVRPGEAAGAFKSEVGPDGVWTIPGIRMKKARAHRVPLSDLAKEVLQDAVGVPTEAKNSPWAPTGDFIFASPYGGGKKPLKTNALRHAMRENAEELGLKPGQSPYSLRKFVATTIGGMCHPGTNIRYRDDDVGMILSHQRKGITQIYNKTEYDEPKRIMLQQLADEIRKRI